MPIKLQSSDDTVTYTTETGLIFPVNEDERSANQTISRAQGQQERVRQNNPNPLRFIDLRLFGESETSKDNLIAFLENAKVNYAFNEIKYFPDSTSGTFLTGRILSTKFKPSREKGSYYKLNIRFQRTHT